MVARTRKAEVLTHADLVAAPAARACTDRSFELPPALHIATAMLFLGFVSVLCLAFASPGLAVPYGICVAFIAAFFAVPTLFAHTGPIDARARALGWSEFMESGIATATGRTDGREAAVLVLLLPTLIFGWSIAIAIIAALV